MKFVALLLFVVSLRAADAPLFVTIANVATPARALIGAAPGTVTAVLVFGGLGGAPDPAWAGKIVLLDRGTHPFAVKVKAVQDAGGVAAVIVDNVTAPLTTFTLAPSTSTIPAVSVTLADREALHAKIGTSARVGLALPPPPEIAIPDPAGNPGAFPQSDGAKYVLTRIPFLDPEVTAATTIAAGSTISFSVRVDGPGPGFTYQWIKNGVNINGATSAVLRIENATADAAGSYVCQVANHNGAKPSGPHLLTVLP